MKTSFLKNFYLKINDSFLRVLKQILHTVCWMNILEKDVFWGVGFFKNEKKMEAFIVKDTWINSSSCKKVHLIVDILGVTIKDIWKLCASTGCF